MIDIIFRPAGLPVDHGVFVRGVFARADHIAVLAVQTPVMALEDVLTTKLMSLDEHALDYGSLVGIVRACREQIDSGDLRRRTAASPQPPDRHLTVCQGVLCARR